VLVLKVSILSWKKTTNTIKNHLIMKIEQFYLILSALIFSIYSCNQSKEKPPEPEKAEVSEVNSIRFELLTDALTNPIQMSVPNDNTHRKFLTDRSGQIWVYKNGTILPKPFLDLGIVKDTIGMEGPEGIGTINGVAFHPKFGTNHKFYVCYNAPTTIEGNPTKLVVSEFLANSENPDLADKKSERRIIEVEGEQIIYNGGEIAFGPDGYLYISIGDDAFGNEDYIHRSQDLDYFYGKLLRIDVSAIPYAIPPDNPFVGMPDARPEIWAYGLRKVWSFTFDSKSKQLFGADVGEIQQEEIDIITKGANLGWPFMEGDSIYREDKNIDKKSLTSPINTYAREDGICIIGGNFYYGKEIPYLKNKLVFGDFQGSIFTLNENAEGKWTRELLEIKNSPEDLFLICGFDTDEDDELYVMGFSNLESGPKGAIYKIVN